MGSTMHYKKMAGTAAVFVLADQHANKPVERQGEIWSAQELHLDTTQAALTSKTSMARSIALEDMERYDQPRPGDVREVSAS